MNDLDIKELRLALIKANNKVEDLEAELTVKNWEVQALRKDRLKTLKTVRELLTDLAKEIEVNNYQIVS